MGVAVNPEKYSRPSGLVNASAAARPLAGPSGLVVALGLCLFAVVWLAQLSQASLSPPPDNIEQLTWVHALEWGYYKHPPLPTWLLWLPVQLFGATAWTSFVTTALLTMVSMGVFWRLLLALRGRQYASVALLAVLCITYYNDRLYFYNHNTVLLLLSTASAALCWKAWSTGRQRWWAALGLTLGLGLLTKYQIAVTVACVVVFWLSQRGWRDSRQRSGLLLAALVALAMFVPHVQWLRTHDFGPIQYAMESSLGKHLGLPERLFVTVNWLLDQLLNRALMAWLLLAAVLYWKRRGPTADTAASPARTNRHPDRASRALLMSWGVVPLVFISLVSMATGAALELPWGTSFLLFAVPAVMEMAGPRGVPSNSALRPALIVFGFIQVFLLVLNQLTSPGGPQALRDHHWRTFDSRALATRLAPLVHAASAGAPVCVVSGPSTISGSLALELPGRPLVMVDGRLDRSPWLNADVLQRCGVLHLGRGIPEQGGKPVGAQFSDFWWRVSPPGLTTLSQLERTAP